MREERLPTSLGSGPNRAAHLGKGGVEVSPRQLFREMVKGEIEDRPLSWSRRRALLRFAARLEIDAFEARLLVRGVEYECGHVAPAAMADVETPVQTDYLAQLGSRDVPFAVAMILLVGVLLGLVLLGSG